MSSKRVDFELKVKCIVIRINGRFNRLTVHGTILSLRFHHSVSLVLPGPLMGTTGNEKSLQQLHMRFEHAQYRFGGATCWAVTACRARPMLFRCLLTLFNPVFHNTSLFSGTAKQQRKRLRVNY